MDHNESMRKFEHLMGREADHSQETAIELKSLIAVLPEKSRQLAELQVKASHQHAREFRELIVKIKEN